MSTKSLKLSTISTPKDQGWQETLAERSQESSGPKAKSTAKELVSLFFTANILVFSFVGCLKLVSYFSYVAEPLYYIRTIDGDYYSTKFTHYGSSVTFLHNGEVVKKSQEGLKGTVVERIR